MDNDKYMYINRVFPSASAACPPSADSLYEINLFSFNNIIGKHVCVVILNPEIFKNARK